MDRKAHKELLAQYIQLGGDPDVIKRLSSFSLINHSKIKFLIRNLNKADKDENIDPGQNDSQPEEKSTSEPIREHKGIFSDLISNYPAELHDVFKLRYQHWLNACSLKQQLNNVDISDESKALDIQWKILENIEAMDACQKALNHYKEYKRLLPVKASVNFNDLSPIELLNKRNNLRSNITKRTKTLKEMESKIPEKGDKDYNLKLHLVNRKKEQLQEYINQVAELDKLINSLVYLNYGKKILYNRPQKRRKYI